MLNLDPLKTVLSTIYRSLQFKTFKYSYLYDPHDAKDCDSRSQVICPGTMLGLYIFDWASTSTTTTPWLYINFSTGGAVAERCLFLQHSFRHPINHMSLLGQVMVFDFEQ